MNIRSYKRCFFKLIVCTCILTYYLLMKFILKDVNKGTNKIGIKGLLYHKSDHLIQDVSAGTLDDKDQDIVKESAPVYYLGINTWGRFGNQLGGYAALYALSKTNPSWIPYLAVDGHQAIKEVFHSTLSIKTLRLIPENNTKFILFPNEYSNASDAIHRFKSWPLQNTTLIGFPASWRFHQGFEKDLKKEFQFPQKVKTKVNKIFKNLTPVKWEHLNFTRVGIHVRRGDWNTPGYRKKGFYVSESSYFQHAMDYFNQRFERVQFIVTSEDMVWCKANIRGEYVVYPHEKSIIDFALMAMSDHMIKSIGTFGTWAGKLCDGIKVYPGTLPPQGTFRRRELDNGDVYPEDWIPII